MKNIAIFASGSGTNAGNIARLFNQGNRVRVSVVLCNRKNAGVYARMEALGVPVVYIPSSVWDSDPQKILDALAPYKPDLIVLAGFMRAVRPEIIEAYPDRIINIHPSLLPAYGGKGMFGHHVHEAVIANHESQSGVTVHYVTNEIDGGEILMQQTVDITPEDTAETLEAKIHPVEYSLYPRAIVAALARLDSNEDADSDTPANMVDAPAPEVPQIPAQEPPKSVDQAWAEKLKLNYDAAEAAARRAKVEARAKQNTQNSAYAPAPAVPASQASTPSVPEPKSHLTMAILVTVLCCTIPGIIAIVYSSSVNSRYASGDVAGAVKASKTAEGWIIASFVLGLLSATLYFPIMLISSML